MNMLDSALLFINWNVDPVLYEGLISIRWYSLLFISGLFVSYWIVRRLYIQENLPVDKLELLATYIFAGTVIGARLGHCLFYDPGYYLSHPLEMLLPIAIEDGSVKIIGYQGLASHGGAIGVTIALLIYCRKYNENILFLLDKIAVATPLAGAFIRLGNLMNSEIIGKITDVPWAFVFERVDLFPRHPAQLYEAFAYLGLFVIMLFCYKFNYGKRRNGFIFGIFILSLFLLRFVIEYFKINQEAFEEGLFFNMGQLLSVPFIVWGIYLLITRRKPLYE